MALADLILNFVAAGLGAGFASAIQAKFFTKRIEKMLDRLEEHLRQLLKK